jgi:hypothetical protein
MSVASSFEAVAGLLLVFFVPGYTVTKALFPEWRIRGPAGLLRLIEIVTLSFVLSVVLTVLVGYLLLVGTSAGFQAYWTSPVLEGILVVIALAAFLVAYSRKAFARVPPVAPPLEPAGGEEGAWEFLRQLEVLGREERRLEHELRVSSTSERPHLQTRLDEIRAQSAALRAEREAQYAR